jgi:hypothetical protein
MKIRTIAALAALTMVANCMLVVAPEKRAEAAPPCNRQEVSATMLIPEENGIRTEQWTGVYCNDRAVALDDVTSTIADVGRFTRDAMGVLAAVARALETNEQLIRIRQNMQLAADAMRFKRNADCPVDKVPGKSCLTFESVKFERSPSALALAK